MNRQIDLKLIAAATACAAAVILFGSTLAGAIGAAHVETTALPPEVTDLDSTAASAGEVISMQAVSEAVEVAPFSPDRQPAAKPYRLPGEVEPAPPPPPPPPPALPAFKLVGTTQTATGGVALIQIADATPRMVTVGEQIGGFRVDRIERTSAALSQGDRGVVLNLEQPSMRGTPQQTNGRRGQGPGNGRFQVDVARERLEEMTELMRRAGRGGREGATVIVNGTPVRRLQLDSVTFVRDTTLPPRVP